MKAVRLVYTQLVHSCPSCPRRESRHTRQARRQDAFTYAASSTYRTATAGVIGSVLRFGQVIAPQACPDERGLGKLNHNSRARKQHMFTSHQRDKHECAMQRTFRAFASLCSSSPTSSVSSSVSVFSPHIRAHSTHAFRSAGVSGSERSESGSSACSRRSRSNSQRWDKCAGTSRDSAANTNTGASAPSRTETRGEPPSIVFILSISRCGSLQAPQQYVRELLDQ